jgi:hypothetical protein
MHEFELNHREWLRAARIAVQSYKPGTCLRLKALPVDQYYWYRHKITSSHVPLHSPVHSYRSGTTTYQEGNSSFLLPWNSRRLISNSPRFRIEVAERFSKAGSEACLLLWSLMRMRMSLSLTRTVDLLRYGGHQLDNRTCHNAKLRLAGKGIF